MATLVALLSACSGGDEPEPDDPRCLETMSPVGAPSAGNARFVGVIDVTDVRQFEIDAAGALSETHIGRITGTFADYMNVETGTPAMELPLGDTCRGIVSRSQPGSPRRVAIESLVVRGTSQGEVTVAQAVPGVHREISDPFLDGASELTAVITSSGAFPSFEGRFTPAEPITLTEPVSDGTGELTRAGVRLRWNEGNGDAVVIVIQPFDPNGMVQSGGQVICEVIDDGCMDVPATAATFLLGANVDTYKLIVARVVANGAVADDQTFIRMDSASEWRTDLDNGVFE